MGRVPKPPDTSLRPLYWTNTAAPSWVSTVARTSTLRSVPSAVTVAQSAAAEPRSLAWMRSPSISQDVTSTMMRAP